MLPAPKYFKPQDFIENYKYHMDYNELHEKEEQPGGGGTQVIENRPPLDRSVFYMDTRPETLQQGAAAMMVYAVSTTSMAAMLEARGYTRIGGSWLGPGSQLPVRLEGAGGAGGSGASTSTSTSKPLAKLTCKYPTIKKGRDAPTPAAQIVEWFEGKVEIDGSPYSPLYMWTRDARERQWEETAKKKQTVSNQLNSLAHMYLYIIQHMRQEGRAASDLELGFDRLRIATRDALKKEGKGKAEDSWWAQAERLAKARVEAPPSAATAPAAAAAASAAEAAAAAESAAEAAAEAAAAAPAAAAAAAAAAPAAADSASNPAAPAAPAAVGAEP